MEQLQQLSFKELFTSVIADMARAIADRPDETKPRHFARVQVATHMILGLHPRDAIEAMFAGQSVMLHAVMTDSVHDTLEGQVDTMRRATRSNIVALNKAFRASIDKLESYQTRRAEGTREASGEAEKKESARPRTNRPPAPAYHPSDEEIAACEANPEAMAAIEAGDALRFARAMGIEQPSEAYLAAAAGLPVDIDGKLPDQKRSKTSGG